MPMGGGGKKGDSGGQGFNAASGASQQVADLATRLVNEFAPVRGASISRLMEILGGGGGGGGASPGALQRLSGRGDHERLHWTARILTGGGFVPLSASPAPTPMAAGDNTGAPSAFWQAVDIPRARMLADQMNVFGPERATIENQYGTARENILSRVPRGGDLSRLLTTNEMGRARNASVMSLTWELSAPRIVAFEHAEQSRA